MNDITAVRAILDNQPTATTEGATDASQETDNDLEEQGQEVNDGLPEEQDIESQQDDQEENIEQQSNELLDDADQPGTIAELAKAIEVEPSYLYGIKIGMGDGKEAVTIGELKDQYQTLVKDNATLKNQSGNYEQIGARAQGISEEMITAFGDMDAIKRQYAALDWEAIEKQNPGEAALLRQKYTEAFTEVQGKAQQAEQQMNRHNQENMQRAAGKALELIPEWKDETVRKADQSDMREAMITAGYPPGVIETISDPIALSLMRELVQLRKQAAGGADAVKRVRNAPKILKSGGRVKASSAADKTARLVRKAQNAKVGNKRSAELNAAKSILGLG